MMSKTEKKQKQSSSIHRKIRNAGFVPVEPLKARNFISIGKQKVISVYGKMRVSWKRRINSILQKPPLWIALVNWKVVKEDSITWFIEAAIEGFIANFATHFLLGIPFTLWTMLAHGFAIKQGISIFWRLRKDGGTPNLPKKDD
jgi:hypothetical protein